MLHPSLRRVRPDGGFSLMEMMVTLVIFGLLAAAVITVLLVSAKQKAATTNELGATEMARTAMDMLQRDLRCAGYGVDATYSTPQPPIAYVDSTQILINADLTPYPDTSTTQRGVPLAYNPAGNPKPFPLNGTSWTPPIRYRTGAETIRWTLDLNNDGVVDANDFSQTDAGDANRTPNPNDYELCREVYGDSTANVVGNNGGSRERIALIRKPGGSQPPLFRVYLEGSSTPWDWANGPVPANRLQEIVKIEINVVATSATKNFLGQYSDTRLTSTVNEIRNAPNFANVLYSVSGYVYNDANKNHVKDGAETGVSGATVTLGGYLTQTVGATGAFAFSVPPGTYVLTQGLPANYGTFTNPDSFTVTVGPSTTCSFADTARAGGWVTVTVYNDVDKNKSYGGSDKPMVDLEVSLGGSDDVYNTDSNGQAVIFAPVGNWAITAAVPDSFLTSTPNPVTGSITNGQSKTASIGMYVYDSGTLSGTVYNDANGNGILDGGETGVTNAYVSVTLPDSTVLYSYTDGHGNYAIKVPTNDPPKTTPYTIVCTPPSGFASGIKTTITNVFVQTSQTLSNQNFPLGKFAVWQHDTDIPMSAIAAADFIENDWTGNATKHAHQDLDLITGGDGPVSWYLEQWFNQYPNNPLFLGNSSVRRTPSYSVYSIACDTLMAGSGGFTRPDVICGQRYRASGNWTIWYTQNGTGNEGFLPSTVSQSYLTSDNGDVSTVLTVPPTTAGASPDIIVGTRSPASGQGVIEVWHAASHSNPVYVRAQTIPPNVPGNNLGEVASMQLADVDPNAAGPELVVGTLTGYYTGQVYVFKNSNGNWVYDWGTTLAADAVTAINVQDVDNDHKLDIVAGTQSGHNSGHLYYWKNNGGNPLTFKVPVVQTASGIVTALNSADYGGDGVEDVIVGWRDSDTTFGGGLEIWYTNTKTLPASGSDPTGGKVKNWVTGIVVGDFNYGVWPVSSTATPLVDIAGVARKDSNHGQLFTLIR